MSIKHGLLVVMLAALALWPAASTADGSVARAAATCDDYPNQKAAQESADTLDADGDGIYCESLPCPCSIEAGGGGGGDDKAGDNPEVAPSRVRCSGWSSARPSTRTSASTSAARSAEVGRGSTDSTAAAPTPAATGYFGGYPTKDGYDRDEVPPAVGRGKGKGLERGRNPRGWKADVRYVPSSENRSHGASLGAKLSEFCSGTRFRYVFR
jgi:hypothetical protein